MDKELAARVMAAVSAKNAESSLTTTKVKHLGDQETAMHFMEFVDNLRSVLTSGKFWASVSDVVQKYFLEELQKKTGLEISEISEAGLAAAIGKRAGFDLHSLHDVDVIQVDLMRAAADRIAARMGWQFDRVIDSGPALIDALVAKAASEIEKKVEGLSLGDLRDVDRTVEDVKRWAAGRIEARAGIILSDIGDAVKTKASVLRWADKECRQRIGTGGQNPSGVKMTKKAIRNRLAQRKFYAAHGDRHIMPSVKD